MTSNFRRDLADLARAMDEHNIPEPSVVPAPVAYLEHWRSQGAPIPTPTPTGVFNIGVHRVIATRPIPVEN